MRMSRVVAMAPQEGHVAPLPLMVPAPRVRSCSRLCAAFPWPSGTPCSTPKSMRPASFRGVQRQQHALVLLPAQPARLEERDLGPATAAPHGARPEPGHGRLRHPARVGVVLQVERVELRVERRRRHVSMLVGNEKPGRPGAISQRRRSSRGSPPPLAPDRFELRIRGVARGQLSPYLVQHPLPPCPQVPRQTRARSRRLVTIGA